MLIMSYASVVDSILCDNQYVTCSGETGNKSELLVSDFGINIIPYDLFNHATNPAWKARFD